MAIATLWFLAVAYAFESRRAPRLPNSPFPVSQQPNVVTVFDVAGASWETKVLVLSAAGVVAQRSPELAVVDSQGIVAPDRSEGGVAAWHLKLLPVELNWAVKVVHVLRLHMRSSTCIVA